MNAANVGSASGKSGGVVEPLPGDVSRVLELADEFLRDWAENEGAEGSESEAECSAAVAAYRRAAPLIRAASALRQALADVLPLARARADEMREWSERASAAPAVKSDAKARYLQADAATAGALRLLDNLGAMPAPSQTSPRVRMVCAECGSEDVQADAYASWDFEGQAWELDTTFDKGHVCNNCGGECSINEEEV